MTEYITNINDEKIKGIILKPGEVLRLRCYSTEGTADARINAVRSDLREIAPAGEEADTSEAYGQELIDNGLVEGRLVGGIFANICKFANALELGSVAALGYTEFEIKTKITSGVASFGLCVRALKG